MLWLQERKAAKHLRVVKVATVAHLTDKVLGKSNVDEFFEDIGHAELHAETVDLKPKEVKKPKGVKIAVEAMEIELMDANS